MSKFFDFTTIVIGVFLIIFVALILANTVEENRVKDVLKEEPHLVSFTCNNENQTVLANSVKENNGCLSFTDKEGLEIKICDIPYLLVKVVE